MMKTIIFFVVAVIVSQIVGVSLIAFQDLIGWREQYSTVEFVLFSICLTGFFAYGSGYLTFTHLQRRFNKEED